LEFLLVGEATILPSKPDIFFVPQYADDTSFNRLVLKSRLPVVVLCVAPDSQECQQCIIIFSELAQHYAEQICAVILNIDESPMICTSFGILSAPTYAVFRTGEQLTQALGYLPEPLLDLFFQLALTLERPQFGMWYPIEQEIEDLLILPMLTSWGWYTQRQVQCKLPGSTKARRGIIDILVAIDDATSPFTLFENKRRIRDSAELERAATQALGYATALGLASFVIADAARVWVYRVHISAGAKHSYPESDCNQLVNESFTPAMCAQATLVFQDAWYAVEGDASQLRDVVMAVGEN
jgi:thioredoxin 1